MNTTKSSLRLSVVVCTHNPRLDILRKTLDALASQTLPKSQWELLLIDNASEPALKTDLLDANQRLSPRIVREPRKGTIFARARGLAEIQSELVVFVDDDNWLADDYLATALRIATAEPHLGAFAGIAEPVLEHPIAHSLRSALSFLGNRNFGPEAITSTQEHWGPWEPIGAGMVFRASVAREFVEWFTSDARMHNIGRRGTKLRNCEDTLIARCAYRLGLACSYQPELKLRHFMKADRLNARYMRQLALGTGASYADLDEIQYGERLPAASRLGRWRLVPWILRALRNARRSYPGAWRIHWNNSLGYFLRSFVTHGRLPDYERARQRQIAESRQAMGKRAA